MCCLCGVRWKGSRFYMQFLPKSVGSSYSASGSSRVASDGTLKSEKEKEISEKVKDVGKHVGL